MLALLGSTGYVGAAILDAVRRHDLPHVVLTRDDVDPSGPDRLAARLRETGATFLINVAGYTGKPNVDACETDKAACLYGNAVLPGQIREACDLAGIPFGHVSSGCIFTGTRPDGTGFTEDDPPNFSFRDDPCSFYSGTKALGEEILADCDTCFIWRLRIPFDHVDSPRNYLTKLLRYPRLLDATNSLSHLGQFADACVQSWAKRIPFGTYNVVNGGAITSREVTQLLGEYLVPDRTFEFFSDEDDFMAKAAKTPRSNCVLDNSKILAAGITMSPVEEAIRDSLANWRESELA